MFSSELKAFHKYSKFIKEIDLHKINESIVKDEETMDFLYDSEEHYTISKFLAIARKSQECKNKFYWIFF